MLVSRKPWNADWRTRATQPSLTACSATGVSGRHVIANVAMVCPTSDSRTATCLKVCVHA
eukprot:898334-Amphidinium_carterae.1